MTEEEIPRAIGIVWNSGFLAGYIWGLASTIAVALIIFGFI